MKIIKTKKKTVTVPKKSKGKSPEDLQAQLAEAQKQLRIAQKKLAKSGKKANVDLVQVAKEAAAEARKAALKEAGKGSKAMQKQLQELLAESKRTKLKTIKANLMKRYGNRLIAAMLVGDTKEELEASAVRAHKAWKGAVKGVGHPVEDDDEDDEDTDEEDEDEEDEDEEDLDTDEDEDEDQDEDEEEEEETPRKKKKAPAPSHHRNRGLPPVIPTPRNKSTGLPRGDQRSFLKTVKGMSPEEFRANHTKIMAAARQTWS